MDATTLQTAAAIATACLGIVVYVVRSEGAKTAADLKAHVDGCEIRERQHDERHADVKATLTRLETKLDRVLEDRE